MKENQKQFAYPLDTSMTDRQTDNHSMAAPEVAQLHRQVWWCPGKSMERLALCYTGREISISEPWPLRNVGLQNRYPQKSNILNGGLMAERTFFIAAEPWACDSVLICSADDLEVWRPVEMRPISFLPSCLGQMKLQPWRSSDTRFHANKPNPSQVYHYYTAWRSPNQHHFFTCS